MTSHPARLYTVAAVLLVFFVTWAAIAARPWQSAAKTTADPRLVALVQREHHLRDEAKVVQRILDRRFAAYRKALARRRAELAAARTAARAAATPSVRVVTLPPLIVTRTS
jgi:hypothetical protein